MSSWVRGEQREDSDVDLLVDFDGPLTGWGEIDIELEIEDRLGLDVDLVPRKQLKPSTGVRIGREAQSVYAQADSLSPIADFKRTA